MARWWMGCLAVVVGLSAWVAVAAPVSNQAGAAQPGGAGVPRPTATPAALPGTQRMSAPEAVPPVLRTPAVDDAVTSKPVPVDMPKIKDLHVLMEKMKPAHKKTGDKNPEVARKAAAEVHQLALASLHPRFRKADPRWEPLAEDLVFKSLAVKKALEPGADRATYLSAFKAQNESCNACHRVFRVED